MPRIMSTFTEIEQEFMQRIQTMVYCSAATVDNQARPRSRIIHPIWQDGIGWFHTMTNSAKTKQLAVNPHMSLAYIAEPFKPVYVECMVTSQNDPVTRRRIWELCKSIPAPLGFDPAINWGEVDSPGYVLLRLEPWRIELYDLLDQPNRKEWYAQQ